MQEEWLGRVSERSIRDLLGARTYQRGAAYARQGRVSKLEVDEARRTVSAEVHGQGASPYRTVVTATAAAGGATSRWSGRCTCPLGGDCKHVAAVMLAAGEAVGNAAARRAPNPWERTIAELVQTSGNEEADGGAAPLGLQLEVVAPRQPGVPVPRAARSTAHVPARRVRIRPVVPGRSGNWVRSGISWRDLQYDYGYPRRVRAHRDVLRELYLAHQATRTGYYTYGDTPVYLDELGPGVWRLLERAVEVGVELVPVKASAGPVTLAPEPAHVALDLRRASTAADAVLAPVVTIGGERVRPESVAFLGEPAHGVLVEASGLLLAPLRERTSERVSRLLANGQAVSIPAEHLDRFLGEYYPALRQVVPVTSTDGSVDLPEIAPPKLGVALTYAANHRLTLQWSFAYPVGDGVRHLPLSGPAPSRAVRDVRAERDLLRGLDLPPHVLPQLRAGTTDGSLAPQVELHGMDAVVFTEEVLPVLSERDDVVVQVTGTPPDYRHSEAAPLVRVSTADSADDPDWFELGIRVSIEGEEIPFQDLFVALARGDSHLVLDSGTYFSLDRSELEQLRRLIDEARALQDHESDGLRISRYQAALWEELLELGVVDAQSERWARSVEGLLEIGEVDPPPAPGGLDAELRPYQLEGYQWLSFLWDLGLGGILADDMGLGKTVQTLAMVCRAHEEGRLDQPVLVVAPTSVVANWAREAGRFAPKLQVSTVTQTDARRDCSLADHIAGADVVITSYALFRLDYETYDALPWSGLVLDEAQFVKNHQAKTYQCARRLPAPFKLAITGTPLENSLMDLWSLLSIVAPGLFPSPQRFSEFYRTPIERGGSPELLAALRRRIRPLLRRRTKEQVAAELPPKQEQLLEVELSPRHQKIYQTHLQRERQKVLGLIDDMDRNRFAIFRSLTLLRQLSLDPALVDEKYAAVRSSKVDALLEQLQEVVSEGHRALVFSQFTGFLRRVRDRLDADGVPYVYLDGRTRNRDQRIDAFKTGQAPVFLISLKAGGFGLNLTEADYCFVLDPWWNPAVEAQAVDRAHRIGQDKTVMVYRLVSAGTIEEKVMELKARKADLFARVMDDEALLSSPLTAEDIQGLLAG